MNTLGQWVICAGLPPGTCDIHRPLDIEDLVADLLSHPEYFAGPTPSVVPPVPVATLKVDIPLCTLGVEAVVAAMPPIKNVSELMFVSAPITPPIAPGQ